MAHHIPEPELQDYDVVGSEALLSGIRGSAVAWGLLTILVYGIIQRFRAWYLLRHVPGPFWAGFTDLWLIRKQWGGRLPFESTGLYDRYGPVVRVGPRYVICFDARELRRMWSARSPYKRDVATHRGFRLDPSRDNVISQAGDKEHNLLRSKMASGYSGREVENLHGRIDEQVLKLVRLIERKYVSDASQLRKMDLGLIPQFFTMDVLSSIGFSQPFGYLDADDDLFGYIKTTQATIPVMVITTMIPLATAILQSWVFKPFLPKSEDVVGLGRIMGIANQMVEQRFSDEKEHRGDMLDSFIAHGLTKEEAKAEVMVQILAGSDTTSGAIRTILLYLMGTPGVYSKLRTEIDDAVATGRASSPVIADQEAKALPYLQAVIKEGLRVFPPVTGPTPKVSDQDDVICGVPVPAGTLVGWIAWGMQRNRDVFGDDADVFRPERWVEAPPEKYKEMEYWQMMVFAAGGRWECLGKNIAHLELNKVIFELMRRFDFAMIRPENPWPDCYSSGTTIVKGFDVRVTHREGSGPSE